ncbi:MAG: hypothetical protein DRO43_05205 [Candidatus Hecatellales archaeon]|nr:MAG: hypothetical protein DRO43_05205 [Candidatus Hecatellales archaeon]
MVEPSETLLPHDLQRRFSLNVAGWRIVLSFAPTDKDEDGRLIPAPCSASTPLQAPTPRLSTQPLDAAAVVPTLQTSSNVDLVAPDSPTILTGLAPFLSLCMIFFNALKIGM